MSSILLINNVEDCSKLFSARDDYIRDQTEYDCILMNPQWQVCPKWYYLDGKGPCILTCRDHDNGTKKNMFIFLEIHLNIIFLQELEINYVM